MSLNFEKRSSDAPLTRFLPVDWDGHASARSEVLFAVQEISSSDFELFTNTSIQLQTSRENLFLAGFASLLARITRQELVTISVAKKELAVFNLENDCSFQEAVRQSSFRTPGSDFERTGHTVHYEFLADYTSKERETTFGLRLLVKGNGVQVELASSTGLWQRDTLQNWLGSLLVLLNAACHNPETPVPNLPLWDESAARAFYKRLNCTHTEFSEASLVPARFSTQAKRRPEATAVVAGDAKFTYRELEDLSSQLAGLLVARGAGPNRPVAVCMERGVHLPMALLAVLKSGSFYVPLDPHNPIQRLQGILEECAPVVFLSDNAVASELSQSLNLGSVPLIRADNFREAKNDISVPTLAKLPTAIHASHLAYTIYTSGTTGKPKGVRITHGALLNLICSMWREPGIQETDRTLAVAPISFDIATMDMFLPLCSGGQLVLASRQDAVDPNQLARLINKHEITLLQATPATWRMLVASGWKGSRKLKMISGGEALPRELANSLVRLGDELWNCYGPTETTIYSAVVRIFAGSGFVPVGPPMPNTSFYVMDQAGHPLPPGVPGELYIGGIGVSPGYVARPELTEQRFVPDAFGDQPGKTIFRTGDLVRLAPGNVLEFFGRLDHQVKLRGFRIELGEIESTLRSHPSLSDAVVILREDVPGEPRLVAYVIPNRKEVDAAELREFTGKSLPEYMLPAMIVTLDRYPLSTSGKIDRRALPMPESVPGQLAAEKPKSIEAADHLEEKLLRIFREILHNDSVGVTDSFFRYGGYSLLTVRLFSQIDRELRVKLPISLLFDAPTVRDLARVIRKGVAPSVIVPIRPKGRSAPIFIVQSYLLYSAMLEIVEPDRPIYGVREMGDEREPQSVDDRARKYASEILNIYSSGPLYLAGWCAAGTLTVEIARQLREAGHTVGLVALFDAERPGHTPPTGIKFFLSRMALKIKFHLGRMSRIPWRERWTYMYEALRRNWDATMEAFYAANHRVMFWLHRRFGLSLSEAAYNNVYSTLDGLYDISANPYPGKLNLYRAADVPNFSGMDETLGWSAIATEGVQVNFVPGDHVSMFKKPHVESLATRLQQELQKAESQKIVRRGLRESAGD